MKYSLKSVYKEDFSRELHEAENWNLKYSLDADEEPSRPSLYYYMHWLNDGRKDQSDYDNSEEVKFYDEIPKFQEYDKNWSGFETGLDKKKAPVLFVKNKDGWESIEVEVGVPLMVLEPISTNNMKKNKNEIGNITRQQNLINVKLKTGQVGLINSTNIKHNFATKTSGIIRNQAIGYAVESSVYAAINNKGHEFAIKLALNDSRTSEYKNAIPKEQERFKQIIKNAYDSVKEYIASPDSPNFTDAEDPTDGSATAAVDVPVNANGKKAEIHVKYCDEKRLFGLRKSDGKMSSDLFTKARNDVLKKYTPTLESYKNWVENYKKNPEYNPSLVAEINSDVEKRLSKYGGIEIDQNWLPITKETPEGARNVFIDPRSLIQSAHPPKGPVQSGIHSLLHIDPNLLSRDEFNKVIDELKKDVNNAIKPNEETSPGGVFYFNFDKNGNLVVTLFSVPFDVDIKINNFKAQVNDNSASSSKSYGYIVEVDINEEKLHPFWIQISSLARGKPLQVFKSKDFLKLIKITSGNEINDSYLRKGEILKEVYSHLYSNKKVINEGGAGGHMLHPYEVLEGTPRDLINRIKQYGVSQKLIEKVDGQNLFFTVEKDGTPLFARNKQDMTHQDLIEKFTGHGAEKPFLEGGNAIVQGVQQWKNSGPEFFEQEVIETFHPVEGQKSFINFEIMHPDKENMIKYDKRYIVFHGIVDYEYGPKGREEVYRTNKGERLQKIIRQMKPGVQSAGFILASNRTVNMNALTNVQIAGYVEQIKQIAASIGITEDQDFATGVLNSIKQKLAAAEIETNRETLKKIEDFVLYGEDIEGNSIQGKDVKKLFSKEDAKKLTALGLTSATKASRIISDTLTQFAPIFVNLGIDLLSGVKSAYMSDEFNRKNIDELREKLQVAIDDYNTYVAATPDDEQSNVAKRLKRHVNVVNDTGLENIVNSAVEGGVYDENGDLLKVTGGFAPLNQIIGAAYRDNEGIFPTFIERYRDIEKNESKKYSLKNVFNLIY